MTPTQISQNMLTARKTMGYTKARLSRESGVPVGTINNYEAGTTQPTLSIVIDLADALHLPLDLYIGRGVTPEEQRSKILAKWW